MVHQLNIFYTGNSVLPGEAMMYMQVQLNERQTIWQLKGKSKMVWGFHGVK